MSPESVRRFRENGMHQNEELKGGGPKTVDKLKCIRAPRGSPETGTAEKEWQKITAHKPRAGKSLQCSSRLAVSAEKSVGKRSLIL